MSPAPAKINALQVDCQKCVRALDRCEVGRGNCDGGWYCIECKAGYVLRYLMLCLGLTLLLDVGIGAEDLVMMHSARFASGRF